MLLVELQMSKEHGKNKNKQKVTEVVLRLGIIWR